MKKNYQSPVISIIPLQHQAHLLDGSPVTTIGGNSGFIYGGGGSGEGHAPSMDDWDVWE